MIFMGRRANGEGSQDKKIKKRIEYYRSRKKYNGVTKEFYGKTKKQVMEKVKNFEFSTGNLEQKEIEKINYKTFLYEQ